MWVARDNAAGLQAAPIVAAARLSPISNRYWLLTGVHVAADYRGQGIARQLITELVKNHRCYTFALTHLVDFYCQFNFVKATPDDLPCELAQRFCAYQQQGRHIIAMIRE